MADVLVVRAGALGDFVLTLPVIEALLRAGDRVQVACDPRFAVLLEGMVGALGPPLDVGGPGMLWAFGGRAPRPWTRAYAFSGPTGEALRAAGIADVRAVEATPSGPAADHFARVLGDLAPAPALPRIHAVPGPGGPEVVIAPGSGGAAKRRPLDYWVEVHERLSQAGVPVVWVAGPLEVGEAWPVPPIRPDLRGLVRIAAACRAWLGPDAGPQHLAAAVRRGAGRSPAEVGVVFGPTDPAVWAPPGATSFPWGATPSLLVDTILRPVTTP